MLNINSSKKKMLAAILCLVMIVTSIQVPKRVIYAEGAESLSDYVEDVVVKKNAVDVTKETSIQLTDGDSLKVTYDINIPKGKVATGSAITMDIPEKMIPKIDTTTGIKSPYAVTVSGSAIVLTHEDVDNGESSEGDVSEDTIEGSFVVDYALDLNAVEKDVSFSFDVETKEGTKRYQITYAPKQTIDFITNVQLLIDDDTPIGDTRVDKDSSVIVHYDFSCASGQSLADLGEFSVALPNEINVTGNFTKTLSTEPNDGGVQLCVASVSKENRNVTFTFNEAISSMYDIEGEFEFELKFNKSAIGKVDYKVITFETGNNNIDIGVYFNNPDVIPKIEKSYTKQENHEYSWTTTVTGGNTVAGGATIVEIIHNQELIEGSVAFNGNTLDKTQYELVKVSGEENKWKLSYYISDFGDYDEETDFILTYKTRILDSVYAGGIETTLTNTSSLYDGSKLIDSADVKAGEIIVTPKCFEQSVVINLKAKLATWTFKVNSDEIDMEDPWFEWEIIDKYLVMQDDSFTITSADGTKTYTKAELSTWYVDAEGCYTFDGLKDSSNILNKAVTISFNTTITEDFFKENRPGYEFEVSAFMTWLQPITGGGSGTRIRQGKPENQKQTISYSVVKKQSLEYDESTGMILWEISLNSDTVADAINLSDVVITDIIGDDQTFVSESVKYADDTDTKPTSVSEGKTEENKAYYEVVKDGEKENVVIHFPSVTTSRRVYIQTKVSDSIIYHNVDGEKKVVGNSITVEATGIEGTQTVDDATRKIDSKIIRKESSYDESSHTITWKVHINESGLPIENPVFSDVITKSEIQKYKAGSFEVTKGSEVIVDKDDALDDDKLNSSEPTLVYDFADAKDEKGKINDYYVITYKTYIYNDEDFYENTTISIENTAVLAGTATLDLEKTPFTESAKKIEEVTVSVVTKEAVFEDNQYMIRWRITVNRDGLKLHNATITDCFAGLEGDLEFDATDMTLIKGERVEGKWRVDANTKAWVGTEIAISKDDFKYDTKTKTLVFNLPENSTDAYQLSFTTKIKNKTLKKIKCQNEAIYKNNSGEIEITSQKSMAVANMTLPSGAISGKGKSGTLIIKKYITGTTIPLEGTEFALYDKFGTQVGSIKKTDAQGKVVFEDLTVDGKYTIKEIKPTEGYQINNDIFETTSSTEPIKDNEFIATDGTIEIYSYAELLKTNISFKKVKEVATGDGLQGATFKLYKTNDANETTIETAISDKDGIVTFENIAFGEYTIAETSAPTGYKLSTSIITVTMSVVEPEKGETLYTAKANLSSETYINTTMPGSIEVVLTDADETDKAIEGATFEVYDSNDTCIKEFTTDSYGECDVTGLPLGTYTVKQTEAANGYIKSDETKSTLLELTDRDKVVKFKNDRIKADIKFTVKVDDAEKTPLENVRYELYAKDDDNCSNLIKYIDSTKDGVVCFTDVPYGEYKIIQTDVPAGYEKTNEVISVAITDDIKTLTETIEPEIESSKSNTQYLRICPGSIKVILTDEETSEPIEGAKFAVYDAKNKLVDIFETDENGEFSLTGLALENYSVKQTERTSDYIISDATEVAELTLTNLDETLRFTNHKILADVEFTVKDDIKNLPLKDVTYKLYDKNDTEHVTPIDEKTSGADGVISFKDVPKGEYEIVPTKVPTGYILPTRAIEVDVTDAVEELNEVVTPEGLRSGVHYISATPGSITVVLTDVETDALIEAAEFEVYNSEGVLVDTLTTDANGECRITELPIGTYSVKQTEAASGYIKSTESKTTELKITDRDKVVPFTNHKILATIKFHAKYGNNENLVGATYVLYDVNDTERLYPIKTTVSTTDGLVSFTDVPKGEYVIIQTAVPEGFLLTSEVISVAVTDDVKALNETIVPILPTTGTQFTKEMEGTVVIIIKTKQKGVTYTIFDKDGNELTSKVTDKTGTATFEHVTYGDYTVKQTDAPSGLVISKDEHPAKISQDGDIVTIYIDAIEQLDEYGDFILERDIVDGDDADGDPDTTDVEDEESNTDKTDKGNKNNNKNNDKDKNSNKNGNKDNGNKNNDTNKNGQGTSTTEDGNSKVTDDSSDNSGKDSSTGSGNRSKNDSDANSTNTTGSLPQAGYFFDLSVLLYLAAAVLGVGVVYEAKRKKVRR